MVGDARPRRVDTLGADRPCSRFARGSRSSGTCLPLIVGVAVFDTGANVLIASAYDLGDLTPVTVLAALYPVVVVALAHIVLHERLQRIQLLGAAAALAGAALVAAG